MKIPRAQIAAGILAVVWFTTGCDSAEVDPYLIGTWQRLRDDGTLNDEYAFGRNGRFSFDESTPELPALEDHMTGTYETNGRIAVATATNRTNGKRLRFTFRYHAGPTLFTSLALLPVGDHHGIVGTWEGGYDLEDLDEPSVPADRISRTEAYNADGTFQVTVTTEGEPSWSWGGTYSEISSGTFQAAGVTAEGPRPVETLRLLDDAALTSPTTIWTRK